MKILTVKQIREADRYTIENEPISSPDLMERAASACADWLKKKFKFKIPKGLKVFCGLGNNGGDGLVIARKLADYLNGIEVYIVRFSENTTDEFILNLERLERRREVKIFEIREEGDLPQIGKDELVIDAVFGSGLNRPADGISAKTIKHINASGAEVTAIDIPSGLFAESNEGNDPETVIEADFTLTFQFPKLCFLFDSTHRYVGKWEVLDIGLHKDFLEKTETPYRVLNADHIKAIFRVRNRVSHKGTYGHGLLCVASKGKVGAGILAARAALRSGIGLLTVFAPECAYIPLQTSCPEAMVLSDSEQDLISEIPSLDSFKAIGVGCGIGTDKATQKALKALIRKARKPLILDADALNILALNKKYLDKLPKDSILTPHPKEFERLFGSSIDPHERFQLQRKMSEQYGIYILLKGAFTGITTPEAKGYFNITGNAGMATGGSGDVLTGILTAFMAQGYTSEESCLMGAYLHGLAGDLAAIESSQESMTSADIPEFMGKAFCMVGSKKG